MTASETINGGVGGGAAAAAAVLEPTMLNNATSMQMGGGGVGNITAPPLSGTEVRRIDVKETSVNIDGLKKDVLYELVVKAGNSYGKYEMKVVDWYVAEQVEIGKFVSVCLEVEIMKIFGLTMTIRRVRN